VSEDQFHRDNHYVTRAYLRHFASSKGRVFTYRTLVPCREIPLWKERSVKGVGHLSHLYTRIAAGRETDEIERWLDRDFEAPAADPLQKATSGRRLTPDDWRNLIRFLAAQIVRTPAYLIENLPRWNADSPRLLNSTLQKSVQRLEAAKSAGKAVTLPDAPNSEYLPIRVSAEPDVRPGQQSAQLKATIVVGRGLWLFNMRHLLSPAGATRRLLDHRWSILAPYEGLTWITSDDPVIRLNYYEPGKYDFKGGIGKLGTEILLPLSPHHLLYTRVGCSAPPRGTTLPRAQTEMIRRFIAEHAFRMIFATSPEEDVARLRSRIVSDELFRYERQKWQDWHAEQTAAERKLMGSIAP
jgi:hypothetical protein